MSLAKLAGARAALLATATALAATLLLTGTAAGLVPDAPERLRCAHGDGDVRVLDWDPVDDALYYHVYRGMGDASPTWLATTPDTRYVDNESADADAFTYWVTAVGDTGESSPTSCEGRRVGLTPIVAAVGAVGLGALATFFLLMRL